MALKIKAGSIFMKHVLEVHSKGVTFHETAGFGGVHKFGFGQIDLILMSPTHTLSFQVGRKAFSIPTKPENKKHQEAIQALLQEVRKTAPR